MPHMPQVGEQHRRLQVFVGNWVGEETLLPTAWGPGCSATGRVTCRAACDDFFVVEDYEQERDGRVSFRGHGVFGWDDRLQTFVWYWVDSMGVPPAAAARGHWEGDTLAFTSECEGMTQRYTYRFEGTDRYRFSIESSRDGGGTWQLFMEGAYRRA